MDINPSAATATHRAGIALGSNLGNSLAILNQTLVALDRRPGIRVMAHSQWYQTPPQGPPQPSYWNGCALLQVSLAPVVLLQELLALEAQWGRKRSQVWGPRTLDLDLLFYDDLLLDTVSLQLPHPRLSTRAFVLLPLQEVAPDWRDPRSGQSVAQLLDGVDCTGIYSPYAMSSEEAPHLLQQRLVYQGRKFKFEVNRFRLPNHHEGEWECIRHPGGALAVPLAPDGRLVMVRQYRLLVQDWILEFPAGTLEPGESPSSTINRELEEETGYHAGRWQPVGQFFLAPGYSDEVIYAFLARDLERLTNPPAQDEDEDLEPVLLTPEEVENQIRAGLIMDAKSISSYFLARPFLTA